MQALEDAPLTNTADHQSEEVPGLELKNLDEVQDTIVDSCVSVALFLVIVLE